jgi:hypothetical protein
MVPVRILITAFFKQLPAHVVNKNDYRKQQLPEANECQRQENEKKKGNASCISAVRQTLFSNNAELETHVHFPN